MIAFAQRALNNFFSLKKSPKNDGGQNITPLFFGTFGAEKVCFGLVFKIWADLRLPIVDFFPFIFPFNHIIFSMALTWEMSKKENNGRQFTIDLSDDDDYIDFGTDDELDNPGNSENFTLAELLNRNDRS